MEARQESSPAELLAELTEHCRKHQIGRGNFAQGLVVLSVAVNAAVRLILDRDSTNFSRVVLPLSIAAIAAMYGIDSSVIPRREGKEISRLIAKTSPNQFLMARSILDQHGLNPAEFDEHFRK